MGTVDWEVLRQEVAGLLEEFGRDLVREEAPDLAEWARVIGDSLIWALKQGDEELVTEVRDQALLVLELKRIRLTRQAKETLGMVIEAAYRFALKALAAAA